MRDLPSPFQPLSTLLQAPGAVTPRPSALVPAHRAAAAAVLEVTWARGADDVREAQRLRHQVFVDEMGARLSVPQGTPPGLDVDEFDPFCEHLLVRAVVAPGRSQLVGTYRVLTPDAARRAGGFYSEREFDLGSLASVRPSMVELGRSCVHPDWRSGSVIMALWGALAEFMHRNRLDTMIGCASISMRDGGHCAASLWRRLGQAHAAPAEFRVAPRLPLPVDDLDGSLNVEPPALIKGYLRCGAQVLGAPAWDPDFNTADLPLMMQLKNLSPRYKRHFMGA